MVLPPRLLDHIVGCGCGPLTILLIEFGLNSRPRLNVSHFLRAAKFRPDPSGQASLRTLHARYKDWGHQEKLSPAELGTELRAVIDALGLKCEPCGRDVIVHGAAD